MAFSWERTDGANRLAGGEKAQRTQWTLETTWTPPGKDRNASATSVRGRCTYADVRYTGNPNTAVSYALLEGLQNGKNYLWSLQADRQLSKTMQLSIQYEGRKTGDNRVVHVGRAQVRAVF